MKCKPRIQNQYKDVKTPIRNTQHYGIGTN